jgi:putative sterol carrier protein
MTWFPTLDWFKEYAGAINENENFADLASDWGDGFNGDFLFHVHNIPTDEHVLNELPEELLLLRRMPDEVWEDVPDDIEEQLLEQDGDRPVNEVFDHIGEDLRAELPDWLRDVLEEAEELFASYPTYDEVPDMLSDDLREVLPEHLESLLHQLEEFVDEEGNVYAFLRLENGKCTGVGVSDSPDEYDPGFVLRGEYDAWEEFVRNDDDIITSVMRGNLEPRGDMTFLLEYTDAFVEMGNTVDDVETEYLFSDERRVDPSEMPRTQRALRQG